MIGHLYSWLLYLSDPKRHTDREVKPASIRLPALRKTEKRARRAR